MLEESYALFVPRFPHSATGYMPSENRAREVAMATDAIVLLKEDHKKVQQLFKRFEGLGPNASRTKKEVVDKIVEELSLHSGIEEQIFYPAAREVLEDDSMVLEDLEEHHIMKWTLSELHGMRPEDERFDAKVRVLTELVRHHIEEEEQDLPHPAAAARPQAAPRDRRRDEGSEEVRADPAASARAGHAAAQRHRRRHGRGRRQGHRPHEGRRAESDEGELVTEALQCARVPLPVLLNLDLQDQEHLLPEQPFEVLACARADLFQHRPTLPDDDPFLPSA